MRLTHKKRKARLLTASSNRRAACGAGLLLLSLASGAVLAQEAVDFGLALPADTQSSPAQLGITDELPRIDASLPPDASLVSQSPQPPARLPIPGAILPANTPSAYSTRRVLEIPAGLERHPVRNLAPAPGFEPFTLRNTSASEVQVQLSGALQTEIRYDDNLTDLPRPRAIAGTIGEYTPSLQLRIGSEPGLRSERSAESDYYLQGQYLPTIYERLDAGTARTLQRTIWEAGRATALSIADVRLEYDQNLLGASESDSPEDTYTLLEISPMIAYSLSAKTSVRAQGFYRKISIQDSTTDRSEYVVDAGVDCETSAKATIGIGTELGYIDFNNSEFADQKYQQCYLAWTWKPTPKVTFQTRIGGEVREFANGSKSNRITPVTNTVLNWRPDDRTSVNFGIRVRNEPSVSETGALFQEVRLASDLRREIGWHLYFRGELYLDHRDYDSGETALDTVFRPAIGYHTDVGRLFDSMNIEIYYQRQKTCSNLRDSNYDRNMFGVQSTIYF